MQKLKVSKFMNHSTDHLSSYWSIILFILFFVLIPIGILADVSIPKFFTGKKTAFEAMLQNKMLHALFTFTAKTRNKKKRRLKLRKKGKVILG